MYLEQKVEMLENVCEALSEQVRMLQARGNDEYLTPMECAQRLRVSQNTIYVWIKEGRIKTLKNLGTAYRIPMSQFYETEEKQEKDFSKPVKKKKEEKQKSETRKTTKGNELKQEFEELLKRQGIG